MEAESPSADACQRMSESGFLSGRRSESEKQMTFLIILTAFTGVFGALWLAMRNQEKLGELADERDTNVRDLLIEKRQQRISRYRHDLANHIRTIEALPSDAGQTEVLKTICMVKQDVCRAEGIGVCSRTDDEGWEALARIGSSVELVGLLSNLWDNAIEAVLRMDEPAGQEIQFELHTEDGGVRLIMDNPYGTTPDFITDKGENHGYGLKIIKDTIEGKKGRMEIDMSDHRFCISFTLPERADP